MITNTGKILCNDCGKKLETLHGVTFGVSLDGQHYCMKHYRTHFSEDVIEQIDSNFANSLKHVVPGKISKGAAGSEDFPYAKKAPTGIVSGNIAQKRAEYKARQSDSHFKLDGNEVADITKRWAQGRSNGRR